MEPLRHQPPAGRDAWFLSGSGISSTFAREHGRFRERRAILRSAMPAATQVVRRGLGSAALVAGSTLLTLLVAEGVVRALGLAPAWAPMAWVANTTGSVKPGTVALLAYPSNPRGYFPLDLRDPATLRRYRDEGVLHLDEILPGIPYAIEYRYNSSRFRGPEVPPRRPGVLRVAIVGDSFTLGWGVLEEDAYPRRLGVLLEASAPGRFEVVNSGRAGADFPLLMNVFEQSLVLEPDLVVYAMVLNDPERSAVMAGRLRQGALREANNFFIPQRAPEPPRPPLRSRLLALVRDRLEAHRTREEMVRWHLDLFGDANAGGWTRTRDQIRQMRDGAEAHGARFLLVLWPLLADLDGDYPLAPAHETVRRFADKARIAFHDLLPALRGRRTADLWVHPIDRHPNQIAHRLAAESLAAPVRSALESGTAKRSSPEPRIDPQGRVGLVP